MVISLKPGECKKNVALFHKNTCARLTQAINTLKDRYPALKYTVIVSRRGRDKEKKTYIMKSSSVVESILCINPSNWKIFRWLYVKGKISLLEYIIAYSLDYSTLNRLLGHAIS